MVRPAIARITAARKPGASIYPFNILWDPCYLLEGVHVHQNFFFFFFGMTRWIDIGSRAFNAVSR